MNGHSKAFTLIELLVVVAIISILTAILFPVFARARENARRASCMSNLKQLGLGIMQYTQDYDEMYPKIAYDSDGTNDVLVPYPNGISARSNWVMRIYPYVKSVQIFNCPSNSRNPWKGDTDAVSTVSYGANALLMPIPVSIASIEKTSETMLLADSSGDVPYSVFDYYYAPGTPGSSRWVADRHLEGANLVFADGHAKWKKMSRDTNDHPIPPKAAQGVYWYADGHA